MQSLSYVAPSTWNKLNNLTTATSVNCFKHDIENYFFRKFSETETDIYSYVVTTKDKTLSIRAWPG